MASSSLEQRVMREKLAHDEDDVLARASELKARFNHVERTLSYMRAEGIQADLIQGMEGKQVLDYGCGRGIMSLRYLAAGASKVIGIDISSAYVAYATRTCAEAGFAPDRFEFRVMDAHALEFPDAAFDFVIGRGILHHLALAVAIAEIRRVLKPGGRAIFQEPLADNPLLRLFRKLTPRARTVDERPLSAADLEMVNQGFIGETHFYGLVSAPVAMVTSVLTPNSPHNIVARAADAAENWFRRHSWLNSWHQYALLVLRKR